MSNVPYYLPKQRFGSKYGHVEAQDGIVRDGLWDVYNGYMMGMPPSIAHGSAQLGVNLRINLSLYHL